MNRFVNRYAVFAVSVASVLCMAAGVSAAQDGNRVSPLYFGPGALPVPDMPYVSELLYVELDYDHFTGFYGDMTETVFAEARIPLFSERVNLSLWMPVVEFYRYSPEALAHFRPLDGRTSGCQAGNVYVSVDFLLLKERRVLPAVVVRAAIITASGDGEEYARYFDAPGYFFDASLSKSFAIGNGFFRSIAVSAGGGFLCWQVSAHSQNDAYMYGVSAAVSTRLFDLSCAWQGYSGWIGNGDRPMVIKTDLSFKAGSHFRPLLAYEYGLRDWPWHHFRIGVGYVF